MLKVSFFGEGSVADACREILRKSCMIVPEGDSDLWISVHCRRIFKAAPKRGILNLHNSYLPWNKGAHACTWAIIDRTPHGATVHWVDQGVDTGPIMVQRAIEIRPGETADSLYKRTAALEVELFKEAVEMIVRYDGNPQMLPRYPQKEQGTSHLKSDFTRLVRALTTSDCRVSYDA